MEELYTSPSFGVASVKIVTAGAPYPASPSGSNGKVCQIAVRPKGRPISPDAVAKAKLK